MTLTALFLIAISLSFDAFGACVSRGAALRKIPGDFALKAAALFSFFSMAAPLAGWALGAAFHDVVALYDHWIAFLLLAAVGLKMVRDGMEKNGATTSTIPPYRILVLVTSALATSIDAAVVGFGLPFLRVNVWLALAVIGGVTFAASFSGMYVGAAGGRAIGRRAEVVGGLILIIIGVKILLEHLYF